MKQFIRNVHLWTGLIFGSILVLQGLTGSLLSWKHELDHWLNPGLLQVAPPPGMKEGGEMRLSPEAVLAATKRLETDPAYGRPSMLMLPERAGDVYVAWYRPGPAQSLWSQPVTRQVMLDPATLRVTGERNWGEAGLSAPLLMPTLFHLHRYLMMGDGGKVVVAIEGAALFLTVLTGLVVWWPRLTRSAIVAALRVRHGGSWQRFSFQLHRAGGFFVAPVLLVTAFTGVNFNMPSWTTPAINAVAPVTPNGKLMNQSDPSARRIDVHHAVAVAQAQYPLARVSRINFPADPKQPFEVRVRQPGELRQGPGATRISIDSGDGSVLRVIDPVRARGGDKIVSTFFPLHTGEAFGIAGRMFISLFGLVPLVFFVTGLVVWLKFRRKPNKAVRASAAKSAIPA